MLFLILLSFIWIFKVINCCISNGNPLKICGLDLFLNNCCFILNSPPHSLTSSIFYWCSKLCVSFFSVISNIILFQRWKTLHLTDHQLRNCFKGNLSRCFLVFFFFFLPNQLWQHVFSDVQEGKKEALIAATSFQVYMKVETWRLNMNSWLKQRRPKILFLV